MTIFPIRLMRTHLPAKVGSDQEADSSKVASDVIFLRNASPVSLYTNALPTGALFLQLICRRFTKFPIKVAVPPSTPCEIII